ncbi:MAG TPA: 2-phospho-L-lactate transferase [Candidatus Eisenbacteria bacterium]|nr:2-phospho-L-lactate transferase [Candidatus Eisenbacteria bacterium]
MIVVLTGGTGGAKLIQGLLHAVAPENLTVIVNTGDDLEWWGLHVSPDIDSVLYALAGALSTDRGWGLENDSFRCLERMARLGQSTWFSLGDLDLATHLARTNLLRSGKSLSSVTAELARKIGVSARVLPMTDDRVATMIETAKGKLNFQEYFVRERHQIEVRAVHFEGAEGAHPAPGVIESIESAEAVILAPSNPVTSIGPILAVPGVREALRRTSAPIVAVSPIIDGAPVSGPAGVLMKRMGWPSTIAGVAQAYEDFLDVLVVDLADHADADHLREGGLHVLCANTVMKTMEDKQELARFTLHAALQARGAKV